MISVSRALRFNFGNYEDMAFTVTITDIPDSTSGEDISRKLDALCAPEVERAELATPYKADENVTSVYTWKEITEGA